MAVEAYFGAETVWTSDIDKYASIVIQERIKKPNLGDLKTVDWNSVEPIDILTAGYPCQPFSTAGSRKGIEDERHIFPYIMQAVSVLRPRIIVLENVRGHLSLGFKEVLQRLAETGYDAKWRIVRASDAGAPHQRARLFVIAYPNCRQRGVSSSQQTTIVADTYCDAHTKSRRTNRDIYATAGEIVNWSNWDVNGIGSSIVTNSTSHGSQDRTQSIRYESSGEMSMRRPPNPLDQGRLNAKFVEYMMGLPEGWVTDLPLSRTQQLKILGNGVVPQQAYLALQLLCDTPKIERDL